MKRLIHIKKIVTIKGTDTTVIVINGRIDQMDSMLTEEMKKRRQDEIALKEKDVKELQKKRFGYEGDLFKKKQELVKPIQDKIYNAVKKLATEQSYAVIFDKSGDLTMLYTNPKYDKSDDVLTALGYKPAKKDGAAGSRSGNPAGGGADRPTMDRSSEGSDKVQIKK